MSDVQAWIENVRIAVVGLGYVGLPLAVEFSKTLPVTGFDVRPERIAALRSGVDETLETSTRELADAAHLTYTTEPGDLRECNVFIVTVPTPIDRHKRPDLSALVGASRTVGAALKPGDLVIYESTVYPGCTEEDCVPELERASGLSFNVDFEVGYSPERINPGDKEHRLPSIRKITSGSTPHAAQKVDALYSRIITAGTHLAPTIKVAEAAKVIENTQRDLNIALVNELAIIFKTLGIDTQAVLEAAGTKWNFLPFRPGLVGGHCIGVDPYYLTHKAEATGYHPHIILAGRRLNDQMGAYVANEMVKEMLKRRLPVNGARVLVMGLSFKENCPDLRNTKVIDVIEELRDYGVDVDVFDPWAAADDARHEYGLELIAEPRAASYDGVIVAVAHREFVEMGPEKIRALCKPDHVLFDLKYVFPADSADIRL